MIFAMYFMMTREYKVLPTNDSIRPTLIRHAQINQAFGKKSSHFYIPIFPGVEKHCSLILSGYANELPYPLAFRIAYT